MRAAVFDRYGPPEVLQIQEVPKPQIGSNEILVRVMAVAVTAADSRIRGSRFPKGFGVLARAVFGLTKPRVKILGNTYSGVVEEVGKDVTDYEPGDEICGLTGSRMGTYAEFIKVSNFKSSAKKPARISHEDVAGMLFGGTAALYFLRERLGVKPGETVVIVGASGAVGTNAVQLAKCFDAKVTAVTSGSNAQLVKDLGANETIDYTKQNLVGSGKKFDVVLDAVGSISPEDAKTLLTEEGRAGLMVASLWEMLRMRGPVKAGTATEKKEDIEFLLSLMEQGKLKTVIDKVYDFDDVVAAHAHVDSGQKVGNVLLKL